MKISSLTSAMVIVAAASVVQVATACSESCKDYMGTPNTEYECAYIHPDCSTFHVGSHAQFKFPKYYAGVPLTYGDGYYCNDGIEADINNVDDACIYKGCGYNGDGCDSYGQCVHYDDSDGVWKCGPPSAESEEEKKMIRGEIVTKEE